MNSDCEENVLLLEDDEGQEHEFNLVYKFMMDDNEYVVLQPVDGDEQVLFKYSQNEDGEDFLYYIEEEEEWEKAVDTYQNMLSVEDA
ncbi:MAG: DUF1292 domain-containing protein [Syntrophaceticus sp.]|jgi:uncharacterized protein YrzB (UPF0473 family)|nr:DUF1292 domain-containing protein [Syntrophaceticus sp.]MDD3314761.1 DUF1292 domain-containing protein [Syntrophaceticus sp.]MDD4359869.1 DUF1292 domain-containing protein [Syntrophaceticus sp.]MDD4782673.1 DUF1292 domain-containing protein [Syntrophaceticus sp.]